MAFLIKEGDVLSEDSTEEEGSKTENEVVRCTYIGRVLDSDGDGSCDSNDEKPQGDAIAPDTEFMTGVLECIDSVT